MLDSGLIETIMFHMDPAVKSKFRETDRQANLLGKSVVEKAVQWRCATATADGSSFSSSLPSSPLASVLNKHQCFSLDLSAMPQFLAELPNHGNTFRASVTKAAPHLVGISRLQITGPEDAVQVVMDILVAACALKAIRSLEVRVCTQQCQQDGSPAYSPNIPLKLLAHISTMTELRSLVVRGHTLSLGPLSRTLKATEAPLSFLSSSFFCSQTEFHLCNFPHVQQLEWVDTGSSPTVVFPTIISHTSSSPFPAIKELTLSHTYSIAHQSELNRVSHVLHNLIWNIPSAASITVRSADNHGHTAGFSLDHQLVSLLSSLPNLRRLAVGGFCVEAATGGQLRLLTELTCNFVTAQQLLDIAPNITTLHCDGCGIDKVLLSPLTTQLHQQITTLSLPAGMIISDGSECRAAVNFGVHSSGMAAADEVPLDFSQHLRMTAFTLTICSSNQYVANFPPHQRALAHALISQAALHIVSHYLSEIRFAPSLTSLTLVRASLLESPTPLARLTRLTHLQLTECEVTYTGLREIIACAPALLEIRLDNCHRISLQECRILQATNGGCAAFRIVCFDKW